MSKVYTLFVLMNVSLFLHSASLEEMIGQMIMVGFRGTVISEQDQIVKDIQSQKIGGVILFDYDTKLKKYDRNIVSVQQTKDLIDSLQKYGKKNLFIAIDQEGGIVCRLKEKYGFSGTVTQAYLGKLNDPDSTAYYAKRTAESLAHCGFNMNFAPVVDVNINPQSPAIGKLERSFSKDWKIVWKNAEIVINEHKKNGILCTLKHFPGHGSAMNDSHHGFTDISNTWKKKELEPYKKLIKKNTADCIMTAHVFHKKWGQYPATMSKKVLTNLLRKKMNFEGLIITDDMNMKAISEQYGVEFAIEKSILAGADILLFANNLSYDNKIAEKVHAIVLKLVQDGIISEQRIEESYLRIQHAKKEIL